MTPTLCCLLIHYIVLGLRGRIQSRACWPISRRWLAEVAFFSPIQLSLFLLFLCSVWLQLHSFFSFPVRPSRIVVSPLLQSYSTITTTTPASTTTATTAPPPCRWVNLSLLWLYLTLTQSTQFFIENPDVGNQSHLEDSRSVYYPYTFFFLPRCQLTYQIARW